MISNHALEIAIAITYAIFLVYFGFSPQPRFASWHMFADLKAIQLDLTIRAPDGATKPLNPWNYLPHTHLSMSLDELRFFLKYLEVFHKLTVEGSATVFDGAKTFSLRIEGNRVLAH